MTRSDSSELTALHQLKEIKQRMSLLLARAASLDQRTDPVILTLARSALSHSQHGIRKLTSTPDSGSDDGS